MTDLELLKVARLLHEETANSAAHRSAGCIIHLLMASLTITLGTAVGGGWGLAVGVAIPAYLAVTRIFRLLAREQRAKANLKSHAEAVREIREINAQPADLHFQVRTPRAVTTYAVQLREEIVIVNPGYAEWRPRDEFELEPPGRGGATRVRLGETWQPAWIEAADYGRYADWAARN